MGGGTVIITLAPGPDLHLLCVYVCVCGMVWYGMVWYGMVWYGPGPEMDLDRSLTISTISDPAYKTM